jgi:hypothetical protein
LQGAGWSGQELFSNFCGRKEGLDYLGWARASTHRLTYFNYSLKTNYLKSKTYYKQNKPLKKKENEYMFFV